jgi:hypothetical protein
MSVMGEAQMLPHLRIWLERTGRLRQATQLVYELPWLGRRVDLALINSRGTTTAFELKIGNIHRALEQATYNRSSFDRSWVVTGNYPRHDAIKWAKQLGIGILLVKEGKALVVLPALQERPNQQAAKRLRGVIRKRAKGEHGAAV